MTEAERLVGLLAERGLSCATAESCTGGGVGAAITSAPGASAVFLGGVASYANSAKESILGVPAETIAAHGAVSAECAAAMAEGARRIFGADLAVSTTGIAGPGGGSAAKPVGLVWFGLATRGGVSTVSRIFPGAREEVRSAAVAQAVALLLRAAGDPGGLPGSD